MESERCLGGGWHSRPMPELSFGSSRLHPSQFEDSYDRVILTKINDNDSHATEICCRKGKGNGWILIFARFFECRYQAAFGGGFGEMW